MGSKTETAVDVIPADKKEKKGLIQTIWGHVVTNLISAILRKYLKVFFSRWGGIVAKWPKLVILCSTLATVILGSGALFLKQEYRTEYLWSITSLQSWDNFLEHKSNFGLFRPQNMIIEAKEGVDLADKEVLSELFQLHNNVLSFSVSSNNKEYNFFDLCYRFYEGGPCFFNSPLRLWSFNETVMLNDPDPHETINNQLDHLGAIVGNVRKDSSGNLVHVGGMLFAYLTSTEFFDDHPNIMTSWEQLFLDEARKPKEYFDAYELAGRSIDDEIARVVSQDSGLIAISVLLTLIFMATILGKRTMVHSKVLLGSTSLVTILFSLIIGFGILGYFQGEFTPISLIVIFILIGIGVDNMIVMVDAFEEHTDPNDPIEIRLSQSLRIAGVAITLTSLTNFIAFMFGSIVSLKGISNFCQTAALAIFSLYFLQITFFAGFLVLDARRVNANRMDVFFCVQFERKRVQPEQKGFIRNLIVNYYAPWLMKKPTKIVVVLVFLCIVSISVFLGTKVETEVELTVGLPDGSYITSYFDASARNFGDQPAPMDIVFRDFDYTDPTNQQKLVDLAAAFAVAPKIVPPVHSWFNAFRGWLDHNNITLTPSTFYPLFNDFLEAPENALWKSDLRFKDGLIFRSRFRTDIEIAESNLVRISDMKRLRNLFKEFGLDGYLYQTFFTFNDRDDKIIGMVFRTLAFTATAVTVSLMLFLSPILALISGVCIVMIDTDLFGLMTLWGVPLDGIAFVCLALAVGLSVDYCVHIGISFWNSKERSGNARVIHALTEIGTSVLNGGLSTLLGIFVLAFASAGSFRVFFKILFGTVLFGVLHGLVFFPVILSLLPPSVVAPSPFEFREKDPKDQALEDNSESKSRDNSKEFSLAELNTLRAINSEDDV